MKNAVKLLALLLTLVLSFSLIACDMDALGDIIDDSLDDIIDGVLGDLSGTDNGDPAPEGSGPVDSFDLSVVPEYTDSPIFIVKNNVPFFTDDQKVAESYEYYGELDSLGRCTYTMACIGRDLMPTEEREGLDTSPSGWVNKRYDSSIVPGGWIYNRCHLIGHQLTGENDNEKNLVTGTRYLNIDGMVGFENMTADYIKETGNHVLYRVTPIFYKNNLLPSGVLMEAYSVEDEGEGICFNVFCYNVQPGVFLYYETGDNCLLGEQGSDTTESGFGVPNTDSGSNDTNTDNGTDNGTNNGTNNGNTDNNGGDTDTEGKNEGTENVGAFDIASVPDYSGTPYAVINGNQPFFHPTCS